MNQSILSGHRLSGQRTKWMHGSRSRPSSSNTCPPDLFFFLLYPSLSSQIELPILNPAIVNTSYMIPSPTHYKHKHHQSLFFIYSSVLQSESTGNQPPELRGNKGQQRTSASSTNASFFPELAAVAAAFARGEEWYLDGRNSEGWSSRRGSQLG